MKLFDYLYVDLDKVVSIYSQLTGGVVEVREFQSEKNSTQNNTRNYDFKVFNHGAGGVSQDKEQDKFIVKPYHALLQDLEAELNSSGFLLDLNETPGTLKDEDFRVLLKKSFCIKCAGRIVIEDYERIKSVGKSFPAVLQLINRSHAQSVIGAEDLNSYDAIIRDLENSSGDRNKVSKDRSKAKRLRAELDSFLNSNKAIDDVPQWILDGMATWIDTFLPGATNIRVYPYKNESDEHVFGYLEKNKFTTSSSDFFHFTYGAFPTEEFTLLGIVTSVPSKLDDEFSALNEFEGETLNDNEIFEKALRGMFKGFKGLEEMSRTCRYPRVLVYPVLVYRQVSSGNHVEVV